MNVRRVVTGQRADGTSVFVSNEYGPTQVYVRPFPPAPGQSQHQVSRNGGIQPIWRDDRQELFFLAVDGTLMSASMTTTNGFQAGPPFASAAACARMESCTARDASPP